MKMALLLWIGLASVTAALAQPMYVGRFSGNALWLTNFTTATGAETIAGERNDIAVSPAGLQAYALSLPTSGITAESATNIVAGVIGTMGRNLLFVDAAYGNNGTALIARPDRPWQTISGAVAAANNGDGIMVMPGNYLETVTGNNLAFYLNSGVVVQRFNLASGVMSIFGYGMLTNWNNTALNVAAGTTAFVECDSISSFGTNTITTSGLLTLKANRAFTYGGTFLTDSSASTVTKTWLTIGQYDVYQEPFLTAPAYVWIAPCSCRVPDTLAPQYVKGGPMTVIP